MADPSMTVCEATSIPRMQDILHEKKDLNKTLSFQIIHYPGATHSIPNSASEWFTHDHEPVVPMENQKKQYMDYNRFIRSIYSNISIVFVLLVVAIVITRTNELIK